MGLCESNQRQSSINDVSHSHYDHQPLKYRTVILQNNLKTIAEESFQSRSGLSSQVDHISRCPSQLPESTGLLIKQFTGFMIQNPSQTVALHSHVVRNQECPKLQEVSTCDSFGHDHDVWTCIAEDDRAIANGNILVVSSSEYMQLYHKITDTYLKVEKKQQQYQLGCAKVIDDFSANEYWKLEVSSDYLQDNSLLRIRHFQSKLYLTRTNHKATMESHRSVTLDHFDNVNSLWIAKIIK